MSFIQIRIDDTLKNQATILFDELGIDLSTAIRLFLKKSLQVGGLPFDVRLSDNTLKGISAIERMRNQSEENGNSEMTLEEINDEIMLARKERKNQIWSIMMLLIQMFLFQPCLKEIHIQVKSLT